MNESFFVQWHILDRCNLRCAHCYQYHFLKERELDWPLLQKVADNLLGAMGTWNVKLDVALTGGEPFLKQELLPLLRYLDKSPHIGDLSIISNGTIFPEYAEELTGLSHFREMRISLDGITEETNDSIRGKGDFEKVLGNINKWNTLHVPVTIMFTAMKRNKHEIPGLIEFGKRNGIHRVVVERFFPLGQGETISSDVLTGQEFLETWNNVLDQAGMEASPEELIPYRALCIDLSEEEIDVLGSGCVVANDGMAILPAGEVLPCRRFTLPIGNLLEASLTDIWEHSPVLNELKNKNNLKGKCGSCNVTDCMGCRAMCLSLKGDYLAEDPHCWI